METKRYFWQADGLDEYGYGSMYPEDPSYPSKELIEKSDFDRVTAERDALQKLLNARDEEADKLRTQLSDLAEAATSLIATVEVHKAKHEFQDDIHSHEKWAMDELNELVSATEENSNNPEHPAPANHNCRSCEDSGCPDCY